ncbi:Gfo/Idh/MocA family protein [Nocardia panacis]|uniref:Gfo/Idh/MocA family protein n=1 Tax=Nocardia panacis TaxID=2340916 RepID=UPI00139698D7|nr:Gfo/Idh/MocA family oxidoreductase [Nocardia panacis]
MSNKIRVGVLGASPERGWAARAHIPALRTLPEFELTAVGTSRRDSAERAARVFGAAHACTDARELAEHPEVDLVVITVKVPAHTELIAAAQAAGKHVYCEWPLTRTTAEAAAAAALAADSDRRHVVGLQARLSPAVRRARALLAEGYVGQVVSATVYAARGKGADGRIPQWAAYTLDADNGAGLLEVAGGHTLDALEYLIGDLTALTADLAVRHPRLVVAESGEPVAATSPDHLLLHGVTAGGAVVSAHIHDGKLTDGRTRIEISGTEGDLVVVSAPPSGPGGIQMSDLRVLGSRGPDSTWQDLTESPTGALPVEVRNVAALYARLATDLRTGERTVPDFAAALHLHRLLDTIRHCAATGTRTETQPRCPEVS